MSNQIRTDWRLFSVILLILAFGLVMVYSASSVVAEVLYRRATWEFAARQIGAAGVGLALLLWLKRVDYRELKHPIWAFVPLSLVVILLVGVIFADPAAHRWYRFFGLQIQPSEMAKPALIVFLAYFVARRHDAINNKHTLGPAALVVVGLVGLIGLGDLGTAAILLAPAAVIFLVAGIEKRYLWASLGLALALGAYGIYQKPYRILRVTSFLGVTEEKIQKEPRLAWLKVTLAGSNARRDAGHHSRQAKIAVGNGHLFGVGLGQGGQKMGFLPEAHTDFIFGVIAEETGLLGCLALLAGYVYIFWRGVRLYWQTPDIFGKYLALGAATMVASQALFNICVVLDLAPTKGIPLPLVSYGGSALVTTLITLGLLLSVSERSR